MHPTLGIIRDIGAQKDAEIARLRSAVADIRSHVPAWIKLLESHVASLPPDRPHAAEADGCFDRSYAEHELAAMKRDLAALLAAALQPPASRRPAPRGSGVEIDMLGRTVTDRVTNFRGVVTGVVEYLTGCNQALVVPPMSSDGKLPDSQWFDVQRLAVVEDVPAVVLDNGATPGCDKPAPRR